MARYIELDALVAEIKKRRDAALMRQQNLESIGQESVINEMVANELNKIISLINTLEVTEVDLDALGVLASHLIACDAHGVTPNYSDREWDFLEGLANNKAQNEDRMVLCEDCKERCAYAIAGVISTNAQLKKESVSEGLEVAAHRCYESNDKFMDGFKKGSNWQKQKDSIVSEELEEAAMQYAKLKHKDTTLQRIVSWDFKAGAKWQKKQMMANTADAMIGLPYENKDGGYTHLIDVSRPLPVGNNKIAIIFKED